MEQIVEFNYKYEKNKVNFIKDIGTMNTTFT